MTEPVWDRNGQMWTFSPANLHAHGITDPTCRWRAAGLFASYRTQADLWHWRGPLTTTPPPEEGTAA